MEGKKVIKSVQFIAADVLAYLRKSVFSDDERLRVSPNF
jgi:hypothetical protein